MRRGMTLIEVMAGVVSLAVVVSAAVTAMYFTSTRSNFAAQRTTVLSRLSQEIEAKRAQVVTGIAPTSSTGQSVSLPGVRGAVSIDTIVTPTVKNTYSVVSTASWGDGQTTSLTDEIGTWLPTGALGTVVSGLTSGLTGSTGLTGLTGGSSGSTGGSGGGSGSGPGASILASSDSDYGDQAAANWTYGAYSGTAATSVTAGSWKFAVRYTAPDANTTGSGEDNYTFDGLSSASSSSYFKQSTTLLEPSAVASKSLTSQALVAARRWNSTKTHTNAWISGTVWMANKGDATFAVYLNGTTLLYSYSFPAGSNGSSQTFSAWIGTLNAGDFVEVRAGAGLSDINDWINFRMDVAGDP